MQFVLWLCEQDIYVVTVITGTEQCPQTWHVRAMLYSHEHDTNRIYCLIIEVTRTEHHLEAASVRGTVHDI